MSETRDRLIEAALRLLDAGGPAAVTLREVGRASGVSHNAPYRHFADKDALLAAVAARELDRQARTLGGQRGHADLKAMLQGYVRWARRRPERFHLVFGRWDSESAELREVAAETKRRFTETVREHQAQGALPPGDPERLGALLRAVAHGAAVLAITGHLGPKKGGAEPEALISDLFDHLQRSTSCSSAERT